MFNQNSGSKKLLSLITLNIWGGRILTPLLDFIKSYQDTDIFCFQEVYSQASQKAINENNGSICLDIQEKIVELLPNHRAYFRPIVNGGHGLSTFVHQNLKVFEEGEHPIYTNTSYSGQGPSHSRILQWTKIYTGIRYLTIINAHGLWNGKGKTDSLARILQSKRIRSFTNSSNNPTILCGDFNLMPNTKSIEILTENVQDFIKRDNIISTRSSFYTKSERYADYIFGTKDIEALEFKVFYDEVSDHLPLYIKFQC